MAAVLRKVALVGGAGKLGKRILKALQADPKFDVAVISRNSSEAVFPPNTRVIKVGDDYPKDEMTQTFRPFDAVVLATGFRTETRVHNALVDASVEAGVKRLIPSVFSGRIDIPEAHNIFPFAAQKGVELDYVKSRVTEGWSYTAVVCGLFIDLCLSNGFFGLDPKLHTGKIWGNGDQEFSCSDMDMVGLSVAKILDKPDETANRVIHISSFEISMNSLLAAYKEATGSSDWTITTGEIDDGIAKAKAALQTPDMGMMDRMRAIGQLALFVELKPELGADFAAAGLLENQLLDLPRGDLLTSVRKTL